MHHCRAFKSSAAIINKYLQQIPHVLPAPQTAKTLRPQSGAASSSAPPPPAAPARSSPGALVTAGGALGATALLVVLATALLLCRRARRPTQDSEYYFTTISMFSASFFNANAIETLMSFGSSIG